MQIQVKPFILSLPSMVMRVITHRDPPSLEGKNHLCAWLKIWARMAQTRRVLTLPAADGGERTEGNLKLVGNGQ
jgi:hypothetical protein